MELLNSDVVKQSAGRTTEIIYGCDLCALQYKNYNDWLRHLVAGGHQSKVAKSFDGWCDNLNERSFIITGLKSLSSLFKNNTEIAMNIMKELANSKRRRFFLFTDCYIQPDLNFMVLQLDSRYAVNALLSSGHYVSGHEIHLSRKDDVYEVDKTDVRPDLIEITDSEHEADECAEFSDNDTVVISSDSSDEVISSGNYGGVNSCGLDDEVRSSESLDEIISSSTRRVPPKKVTRRVKF